MNSKKTILILSALSFFVVAGTAVAQGFVPLAPIPGLTQGATGVIDPTSFANFFNNLYKYCIGLASALAVIMIIWGGLEISTQDSISKQGAGRERITQAIYGLILVLSPVLVFSIINPSILRLDIGIKKLDTVTGAKIPTPVVDLFVSTDSCPLPDLDNCVGRLQSQCDLSKNVLKTSTSLGIAKVTCTLLPSLTSGSSISKAACLLLVKPGLASPAPGAEYWSENCSSAYAQQEVGFYGSKGLVCNKVVEGGSCLYYPPG